MIHFDEYQGRACSDCVMLIANGETPPDLTEDETNAYLAQIDAIWGLNQIHACLTCDEDSHEDFSWSSCDYCGSTLGGSRCPFVVLVPKETDR